MMLDTNAVSAMADQNPAILKVLTVAEELVLPFISVAEFHYGLLGSTHPETGWVLIQRLASTLPVLFPDSITIGHYAWVADHLKRKGRVIPHNDIWTAALARQHSLPILSRDQHFDFIDGIHRIQW